MSSSSKTQNSRDKVRWTSLLGDTEGPNFKTNHRKKDIIGLLVAQNCAMADQEGFCSCGGLQSYFLFLCRDLGYHTPRRSIHHALQVYYQSWWPHFLLAAEGLTLPGNCTAPLQTVHVQLFSEGMRWLLFFLKIALCSSWVLIWASWTKDEPALSKGRWVAASWESWESSTPLSGRRKFTFIGTTLFFNLLFLPFFFFPSKNFLW